MKIFLNLVYHTVLFALQKIQSLGHLYGAPVEVKFRDPERLHAHPSLSLSLFVESQCSLCGCQGISTAADPGSVLLELCHLMEI